MSICSNCGKENPPDASRCVECGADCSVSVPEGDAVEAAGDGSELVVLATFKTVAEADMVQELLENNGIMSVIHGETDPIGAAARAEPISLSVEKQDSANAQELYEAFFAGDASAEENPAAENE
jgi:hypothetical protein